jgi:hypothetical protein
LTYFSSHKIENKGVMETRKEIPAPGEKAPAAQPPAAPPVEGDSKAKEIPK